MVPHFLFRRFRRFASGLLITVLAQSNATEAVVYTALPTGDITRAEKGGFMNGVLTAVHERDRS